MKLYISYFYQIRNFLSFQIPISTAITDPKWYHDNKSPILKNGKLDYHVFLDKNKVLNGLRSESLKPNNNCLNLCHGQPCIQDPSICAFLRQYKKQLESVDKETLINNLIAVGRQVKDIIKFEHEPEIVLIVHEAPSNRCSEREALIDFFGCEELTTLPKMSEIKKESLILYKGYWIPKNVKVPDFYIRERFLVEKEFLNVRIRNGADKYKMVQTNSNYDKCHIDMMEINNNVLIKYDVKDQMEQNRNRLNYSISNAMHRDIELNHNNYQNHYLACKEYDNGIDTGRFIIVPTLKIYQMMYDMNDFWLAPVYEYMKIHNDFKIEK